MKRTIFNAISVIVTAIKLAILKVFHGKRIKFHLIERFSPNVDIDIRKGGKVEFGDAVRIHSGSRIKVQKNGSINIGNNVKVNYDCLFVCMDNICIGDGTEFGPSVYIYDHDHNYKSGFSKNSKDEKFLTSPVSIGKNCWIGANTIILRGTNIGDNCVIGAGSVIKGSFEPNSVIIQKRNTEVIKK